MYRSTKLVHESKEEAARLRVLEQGLDQGCWLIQQVGQIHR